MIIFTRKESKATVFYWELEDIMVEPPYETEFESNRFWRVTLTNSGVATEFDSAPSAKQYIRKYLKSGTIIFEWLGDALEIMDRKRREEEDMEVRQSTEPNGRYEEVGRFPSKSSPGTYYTVKLDATTGDYTCDCKPWIYNKRKDRTCSHTDKLIGNKRSTQEMYAEVKPLKTSTKVAAPISGPTIRPNPRKRKLML